jgi:hypothetical protein
MILDNGTLSIGGVWGCGLFCQVIIRKILPWTIKGNVLTECHAPCTLKTSFVGIEIDRVGPL